VHPAPVVVAVLLARQHAALCIELVAVALIRFWPDIKGEE
jgi:hypothetical protein